MKRFIFITLVCCLFAAGFSCTGDDNYNHRTPTAVIDPTETPVPPPTPTQPPEPVPDLDPPLPKVIGFNMTGDMADPLDQNPYNFQSNEETANQVVENGFQAVHLFAHERVMSHDMKQVIKNPDIRVIAFRPMARVGRDSGTCRESVMTWENADFGQIAWEVLNFCGDLSCRDGAPLTFIINPWETDWQARGIDCPDGVPPYWREYRVLHALQTWQLGVEWARSQFPDAQLQVLNGMVVNHTDPVKYPTYRMVCEGFQKMEHKPDVIGLTHYSLIEEHTPREAIDVIQECTGYPTSRIYVAETGWGRAQRGPQSDWYATVLPEFADAGINLMFAWMWKQYWPGSFDDEGNRVNKWFGLWEVDPESGLPTHESFTGRWTDGLEWIAEWKMQFEDDPLPYVPPPDGATPTPVPTNTPVPPTATPTPDEDPCAECPEPGTIGCTIAYPACVQCWENCGQPIEDTPTPTPVTPTPVPPTPTPEPGDCSHCPAPGSIGCVIAYPACVQCWSDCGSPLATPTPRDTPTPTPTPKPPDTASISTSIEGGAVSHCVWVATHQESGFQTSKTYPECADFDATFNQVGMWSLEMTAHFLHGYSGVEDPCNETEGTLCGDLDGDGLYEFRTYKFIEVLPKPEAPIVS
jgi:hypothetical protein